MAIFQTLYIYNYCVILKKNKISSTFFVFPAINVFYYDTQRIMPLNWMGQATKTFFHFQIMMI